MRCFNKSLCEYLTLSRPSERADLSVRIDRYTEAPTPVRVAAAFTREPLSPSGLMRFSHHSPAKLARLPGSHSNIDIENQNVLQEESRPRRSTSMILSRVTPKNSYRHDQSAEPRIFPGLVHERTRRGSVKRENGSEYDSDVIASAGLGGSRRGFEKVENGLRRAVLGTPDTEISDGDTQ